MHDFRRRVHPFQYGRCKPDAKDGKYYGKGYGKPCRAVNYAVQFVKFAAGKFACGYNADADGQADKKADDDYNDKRAGADCCGSVFAKVLPHED